ncbi:MAG: AAA family ATPase [Proteobacteria bacterium]|nr:AAA family ATPase [Pseudomonadota bacterium]
MGARLPLLERDAAADALRDALVAAGVGAGGVALVSGEAGIGKTTLVDEFVAGITEATVLRGACEALFTPHPLGPLHDVARDAPPALRERLAARLREDGNRPALFAAVLDILAHGRAPTVLILEDVHWADAATLDLVRHVGRRISRLPALLVLTFRDDELDAHPALRLALADLPSRAVVRVPLFRLSPPAVTTLAQAAGVSDTGVFLASGGNPFFVTELLRHPEGGVPITVRDSVLGRAARLAAAPRALLDLVAIVPRAAELTVVSAVATPTLDDIDACVRSGLLLADATTLRFRHELARVAVADALAPPRAQALHASVLAALRAGGTSVPLARLAHHARFAGDREALAELAPAAAREAAARGARREAIAHCEAALALGHALAPPARAALLAQLAEHRFETNDLAGAIAAHEDAIAAFTALGDLPSAALAHAALAMTLVRALRNQEAAAASRRALDLVAGHGDAAHVGRVYAIETYLRMLNRDCASAVEWGDHARAIATRHGDRTTLAAVGTWSGAARMYLDFERGYAEVEQALAAAQTLDDGGVRAADAWVMLGTASGELFALERAERHLDAGIAFARERDLDRAGSYMEAWRALVLLHRGRWHDAETEARAVLAREAQGSTNRLMALVALARLHTRRGDDATALLDEALALASSTGTLQRIAPVRAARAEAAWLAGDTVATAAEVDDALALASAKQHGWYAGELAAWRARAGMPTAIPSPCAPPWRHVLHGEWAAAAAAWSALGCPYEAAMAQADGDRDARLQALATFDALGARPLAERLRARMRDDGGGPVPRGPRASTRSHPAGLTVRETEILALVAEGLSNADIAARLSRSERTVEHHLAALLAKLGARTRSAAVEVARKQGLLHAK